MNYGVAHTMADQSRKDNRNKLVPSCNIGERTNLHLEPLSVYGGLFASYRLLSLLFPV